QPIRFRIQKRVQRLLHAAPHHSVKVVLDPLVVDRDDIVQQTWCSLGHGGSFSAYLVAFATSKSARFGAASPTYLCERFCTSSQGQSVRMTDPRGSGRKQDSLGSLRSGSMPS